MAELLAFTAEHVCRLSGLSRRQLSYWDKTGFFSPTYVDGHGHRPFGRIYSFKNLVGLRMIALLRRQVPLQELRKVGEWLAANYDAAWSSLVFYVLGRKVYFQDPESRARLAARPGRQSATPFEMKRIAHDTEIAALRLRERTSDDVGVIKQNRLIAHNAPVVSGTRVPTQAIWNFYTGGYSVNQIIAEYPRLTPEDVDAAISFEEKRRAARAS